MKLILLTLAYAVAQKVTCSGDGTSACCSIQGVTTCSRINDGFTGLTTIDAAELLSSLRATSARGSAQDDDDDASTTRAAGSAANAGSSAARSSVAVDNNRAAVVPVCGGVLAMLACAANLL